LIPIADYKPLLEDAADLAAVEVHRMKARSGDGKTVLENGGNGGGRRMEREPAGDTAFAVETWGVADAGEVFPCLAGRFVVRIGP